jgi:hypothetical protein
MNEIVLAGTKHQISLDSFQIRKTGVFLKIPCQKQKHECRILTEKESDIGV